jgi:hypothetical protein
MKRPHAALLTALTAVLMIACGASTSGDGQTPSPKPSPRTALTASERAQLAQLEARPLNLSKTARPGCDGPHTATIAPYASGGIVTNAYYTGPVYGEGGPERDTTTTAYDSVTYFTDPSVTGVLLARGRDLDTAAPVVFFGDYATGPVVGQDILNGVQITLHTELAIPTSSKLPDQHGAPGWGIYPITQGVDKNWRCVGIQIDISAGSYVAYAAP